MSEPSFDSMCRNSSGRTTAEAEDPFESSSDLRFERACKADTEVGLGGVELKSRAIALSRKDVALQD